MEWLAPDFEYERQQRRAVHACLQKKERTFKMFRDIFIAFILLLVGFMLLAVALGLGIL